MELIRSAAVFPPRDIRVAEGVLDEMADPRYQGEYMAYIAEGEGSQPVGFICFGPNPLAESSYDLYWIVVAKGSGRRGIGSALLHMMEEEALGQGARRVYVETSSIPPFEAARAFYRKHGYRLACMLEDFYRDGDHKLIFFKGLIR